MEISCSNSHGTTVFSSVCHVVLQLLVSRRIDASISMFNCQRKQKHSTTLSFCGTTKCGDSLLRKRTVMPSKSEERTLPSKLPKWTPVDVDTMKELSMGIIRPIKRKRVFTRGANPSRTHSSWKPSNSSSFSESLSKSASSHSFAFLSTCSTSKSSFKASFSSISISLPSLYIRVIIHNLID
jgi:hypothetical protein